MALFPFFKQRRVRHFEHKLIYSDPAKEKLQRRIETVRERLIKEGELPPEDIDKDETTSETVSRDANERLRGTFIESTSFVRRQKEARAAGKDDRTSRFIKIAIALIAVAAIVWILRTRFGIYI